MRATSTGFLAALAWLFLTSFSVRADYLKNTDFAQGLDLWRGDGSVVYLREDGTESDEMDAKAKPYIKILLSKGETRSVYQEYDTKDNPPTQHIRVEVFASVDFKRSKYPNDYTSGFNEPSGTILYYSDNMTPNVDFWIRCDPGSAYKLSNLKPGKWTKVDALFTSQPITDVRTVAFVVPPGEGAIYIRKPSASK